jgi:hypothetical protein
LNRTMYPTFHRQWHGIIAEDEDRNFDSRPQGGEASEGSRKGRGGGPPPPHGRRLTDRRGAVCGRHSSTVRRISARRVVAETCLRPAACAGALASAPAVRRDQGETGTAAAAGGGARSWVARRAEAPRWSRMRRMTRPSVMKATTRITPRQRGQTSGSVS